jgi:glycosyltransferase involved in cell wall biosynthesis
MATDLTVVIPVYNEAAHVGATVEALLGALARGGIDADLIIVDDGSTDDSAAVAAAAAEGHVPLRVITQPNRGRFHAVREGLHQATGENVFVLGARVSVRPDALQFVRERQEHGELLWVGHVHIHTDGNPYGRFQNVLTEIAWRRYFDDPRAVSFGTDEFDHYPKGSGCLIGPREVIVEAFDDVPTRYADVRYANDDTPMLRQLAAKHDIHVSPSFASDYVPRATLETFLRHSVHRGIVFLDGHGRRESRFFPMVVAFYPVSIVVVIASLHRPRRLALAVAATSAAAGLVAASARRSRGEVATVAALAPVWAVAFGVGLWRGIRMVLAQRKGRKYS